MDITISEYDKNWPDKFSLEKEFLLKIIGTYLCGSVEHVGSTAVPQLAAKPIIDIMFGVKSLAKSRAAIPILEENGYNYYPYKSEVKHWLCKPSPNFRTHHLHLVPYNSPLWHSRLKFRDILRNKKEIASSYAQLKKDLAKKYISDREAYTEAKSSFVNEVLTKFG